MRHFCLSLVVLCVLGSCSPGRRAVSANDDGKIEVVFMQVNDVYEIAPIAGGREGGLARVASMKKELLAKNSNTMLIMAGDFLSPSVYNSLQFNGRRIRGQQMVEAMNAAGTDIAVFGNHEFDITEDELFTRFNESEFDWIASNTFHNRNGSIAAFQRTSGRNRQPFPKYRIYEFADADGTRARIGVFGITLPFNRASYVHYTDPLSTAKEMYALLKDSCDAVVAITHQLIEDDIEMAKQIPGLAVILGGHEHDMRFEQVGSVPVTKAHANARSAYVVTVALDKNAKTVQVSPQLRYIDTSVALDPGTAEVVDKWMKIAEQNYASLGFDAKKVLVPAGDSLDGREVYVRSRSTNLTDLVVRAMADACPEASVAIVNGGSIRLDDVLYPPITQFDILRTLPYGGPIREMEIKGALLTQVLEAGSRNRTGGGYLHSFPTSYDTVQREWKIRGEEIVPGKTYRVAFSDFLITGREQNLDFLHPQNPAVEKVYDAETSNTNAKSDIRLAIVRYLQKQVANQASGNARK